MRDEPPAPGEVWAHSPCRLARIAASPFLILVIGLCLTAPAHAQSDNDSDGIRSGSGGLHCTNFRGATGMPRALCLRMGAADQADCVEAVEDALDIANGTAGCNSDCEGFIAAAQDELGCGGAGEFAGRCEELREVLRVSLCSASDCVDRDADLPAGCSGGAAADIHPAAREACGTCDLDCSGSSDDVAVFGSACDDGNACTADSCNGANCVNSAVADGVACDDYLFCSTGETCQSGACVAGSGSPCTVTVCQSFSCGESDESCAITNLGDGTNCDDGEFCTVEDNCQSGACSGAARDCSGSGDQCNDGVCNEVDDTCEADPKANATACNDTDICTENDVCTDGTCAGTALDCSGVAVGPCQLGVCDPVLGCVAQNVADDTGCDDGEFCTVGDSCQAGACVGAARDCSGAGDQCNDGVCNDESDACEAQAKSNGTVCDDGAFCTDGDSCEAGACVSGAARDCSGAGDQCNDGVCNDESDACEAQAKIDGTGCDDGAFCTDGDACEAGACVSGAARDCSAFDDQCNDGVCNDVDDRCEASAKTDGTGCDDGEFCTDGDACEAGVCESGPARDCSAFTNQCNDGVCDEGADACVANPKIDGTQCDDGAFCTDGDQCAGGDCAPGPARDCSAAGDQCNNGVCDESGDACVAAPIENGSACDDGLFCSDGDLCEDGACTAGPDRDCSAFTDQCNVGVCDELNGVCVAQPVADGTACDDGSFCTDGDSCQAGACVSGAPRDCSAAGDQCNDGICDEVGDACVPDPRPDGLECDDGQFCSDGDSCLSGVCAPGPARDCSAQSDQCNLGVCDEVGDACVPEPLALGTPCTDGEFCTDGDTCDAGVCESGPPRDCSAQSDQCNVGVCDEAGDACVPDPVVDATPCSDGAFCTDGDACEAGSCVPGGPRDCSAQSDQCNTGVCDEEGDACVPDPLDDGTVCDDGRFCSDGDSCQSGRCAAGPDRDCSAFTDQCNDGVCNDVADVCEASPRENGLLCDDGEFCLVDDACENGACVGQPRDCSEAGDQCNAGVCNEIQDACVPEPLEDGLPCEDGDFCSVEDSCQSGLCFAGLPRDCSAAGDQCNDGICDEVGDACVPVAVSVGVICDDGAFCSVSDACAIDADTGLGVCEGAPRSCAETADQCNDAACNEDLDRCDPVPFLDGVRCDDGAFCSVSDACLLPEGGNRSLCRGAGRDCSAAATICHDGVCDEAQSACVPQAQADGTPCDDGAFCTVDDSCTLGECGGAPRDCIDVADACNTGVCDEAGDRCEPVPVVDGTACDDSRVCTENDQCIFGSCAGVLRDCSAVGDGCNGGRCNEQSGACEAVPFPDGTACDDGLFCTDPDRCQLGVDGVSVCGGSARDCSVELGQCLGGACDENRDRCEAAIAPPGTACDDANPCTEADSCELGVCSGETRDCSHLDSVCATGQCDPDTGNCVAVPLLDGLPCNDGLDCTELDRCSAGVCTGFSLDCSGLDGPCVLGICDEQTGGCSVQERPDGASCDDGLFCTDSDLCAGGECVGAPRDCDDPGGCAVGSCDENTDACIVTPASDGTDCDDGLFCTVSDACNAGSCEGSARDCSALEDACNTARCDEVDQRCELDPANEGSDCDDGLFCTAGEVCSQGSCEATGLTDCSALTNASQVGVCDEAADSCVAEPRVGCDDGNPCTDDAPDGLGGCVHTPVANGTACDDGLFCTVGETCDAGACTPIGSRDCSAAGDACNAGFCDEAADACDSTTLDDGTPCDDGLFCTLGESCTGGACGGGSQRGCPSGVDGCRAGRCDEGAGACVLDDQPDGVGCDDGEFCTVGDACLSGSCQGSPRDCSSADGPCATGACNEATDRCLAIARPDGEACDDGQFCTVADRCAEGRCEGDPNPCEAAGGACDDVSCNENADLCESVPRPVDAACDDSEPCTLDDRCDAEGVCSGAAPDCSELDAPCAAGVCDPLTGLCASVAINDGVACDDGNACTSGETCQAGACMGEATVCEASSNPCLARSCDPATGACVLTAVPDGGSCDDGRYCTVGEFCVQGACQGGLPRDCAGAGDACNEGICDEGSDSCIAIVANEGLPCSDGQFCTDADRCVAGHCLGDPRDCSGAGDGLCVVGRCDEGERDCVAETLGDGSPCDDGRFCTVGDSCEAGSCLGGPRSCAALADQCNTGVCDELRDRCNSAPRLDGTACDDGLFCTVADVCEAGSCGGAARDCGDGGGDRCRRVTCDEAEGRCIDEPIAEGGACEDGLFCTVGERCVEGVCVGGVERDCSEVAGQCRVGICDEIGGGCATAPQIEGSSCDDGDPCTIDDRCDGQGGCAGVAQDCSGLDRPGACVVGRCNPLSGACEPFPSDPGAACDDGDLCTVGDSCDVAGVCAGSARDCGEASDACNLGRCNPVDGSCESEPVREGGSCDDGSFCTVDDRCAAGQCEGVARDCSGAGGVCLEGFCDEVAGRCAARPAAAQSACDDGLFCTEGERCDDTGVCGGGDAPDCSGLDDPGAGRVGRCDETAGGCIAVDVVDCDDLNPCTDDGPDGQGGCVHTPVGDGAVCDDGLFCTTGERCQAGVCAGGDLRDCSAENDTCQRGVCDEAGDSCVAVARPDGLACDDGLYCTVDDSCFAGFCDGNPRDCSAVAGPCAAESCNDGSDACEALPAREGLGCDDGDACTQGDSCRAGACRGDALDCSALDALCVLGVCDPDTGSCAAVPEADGTGCDDGRFCTVEDSCQSGTCVGGGSRDCGEGDACTEPVCDDATSACLRVPRLDGTGCDDGDPCVVDESCIQGVCRGRALSCGHLDDSCVVGRCDRDSGGCVAEPVPDGLSCDDGDACTSADRCAAGSCQGSLLDCSGFDGACVVGRCDAQTGACVADARPDGAACDDGLFCVEAERCLSGRCGGGTAVDCSALDDATQLGVCDESQDACGTVPRDGRPDCDDANPCTLDSVDGELCANEPLPDGTGCLPEQSCVQPGLCNAGRCGSVTPIDCSAADDTCNVGVCDPDTGACASAPRPDGTACDDGDPCTVGEQCVAGSCEGGAPNDCAGVFDEDPCSVALCDPDAGGCIALPAEDGILCDDGDPCTVGDSCLAGGCSGAPRDCSGLDGPCMVGGCDAEQGGCVAAPRPDGEACDDGLFCTVGGQCASGECIESPRDCGGNASACQDSVCDEDLRICRLQGRADGAECDDGIFCTVETLCFQGGCGQGRPRDCSSLDSETIIGVCDEESGACVPSPRIGCDDFNPCTRDFADGAGGCIHSNLTDGTECDDGFFCTEGESCFAGECRGGRERVCTGGLAACTLPRCDEDGDRCAEIPAPDGAPCSTGDRCVEGAECDAGSCMGGSPRHCDVDPDDCNAGSCSPISGECLQVPVGDGASCDDGDPCTQSDSCSAGDCGGTPIDCSELDDACNVGVCDPVAGGCVAQPREDSTSCDDGDACTENDRCDAGVCSGAARDCSGFDGECLVGACAAETGECEAVPRLDGTPCDDGDRCTVDPVCFAGVCDGAAKDCSALDGPCAVGACDADSGACVAQPVAEGELCDDGLACTSEERCAAGSCEGGTLLDCSDLDDASKLGVCDEGAGGCVQVPREERPPCDDANPCTDDVQNGGSCVSTPRFDGTACDDGLACTVGEVCTSGVCGGGTAPDCSSFEGPCARGVCDEASGGCIEALAPDGANCDDGDACSAEDRCELGACVGSSRGCESLAVDACEVALCDGDTGVCTTVPAADGVPCEDGLFCTQGDSCQGGVCASGPEGCAGASDCQLSACDEAARRCTLLPAPDGRACDDAIPCTVGDRCVAGSCVSGEVRDCSEQNAPCREGFCEPLSGDCASRPLADGTGCDDGLFCTEGDLCSGGACVGAARDCGSVSGSCQAARCDEALAACVAEDLEEGAPCDDGNACTVEDRCFSGFCDGLPRDCEAALADEVAAAQGCLVALCDPQSQGCVLVEVRDGTACDDGLFCTEGERCEAGACGGGEARDCGEDISPCAPARCDEESNSCTSAPLAEGEVCEDGDPCTEGETCGGGQCTGGVARDCSAEDGPCAIGVCDSIAGGCVAEPLPDGGDCDDGDACTQDERCMAGDCVGQARSCDQPPAGGCTVAICDPDVGDCVEVPAADGLPCEDGAFCTVDDRCDAGVCVAGPPRDCAQSSCRTGSCDEDSDSCGGAALADGSSCDDGLFCTTNDRCEAGSCNGRDRSCAFLDSICADGLCDEARDRCVAEPVEEGTACDDSDICTIGDACVLVGESAACQGTPLDCDDGVDCTEDRCDSRSGECRNDPDNSRCDDVDACTSDVCTTAGCSHVVDLDRDEDGVVNAACEGGLDCDDTRRDVNPGATEVCNGRDDDCDGTTDLDAGGQTLALPCYDGPDGSAGIGQCAAGQRVCTDGRVGLCQGQVLPGPEVCDGLDNDCDGETDGGDRACDTGEAGACAAGRLSCDALDGEGNPVSRPVCTQVHAPSDERCNGVDDDCDGDTDEELGAATCGVGACQATVEQACVDGETVACVPGAPAEEVCNGEDDDCDGLTDESDDRDGDGVLRRACAELLGVAVDCDDRDSRVFPGAREICGNGVDDDCDGGDADCDVDADGDGTPAREDCDDNNERIGPDAEELCNGVDDNCDGVIDEGFDSDGDGVPSCAEDCDDQDAGRAPGLAEICDDGIDQDCDDVDLSCATDGDGDGVVIGEDCDDTDASVHPGAPELCDGRDQDCDGRIDEGLDADGDGFVPCSAGELGGDCDDTDPALNPGAEEICDDGIDNDCDGLTDLCEVDRDLDGSPSGEDCDDQNAARAPGLPEICDGLDNDCDGRTDERCVEPGPSPAPTPPPTMEVTPPPTPPVTTPPPSITPIPTPTPMPPRSPTPTPRGGSSGCECRSGGSADLSAPLFALGLLWLRGRRRRSRR